VIKMARIAPEKSNFFVRSNYPLGVESKLERSVVEKHSLEAATHSSLSLIEQAIARVEQGTEAEAALRELWAHLVGLRHLRASNPGTRMAAQDLYDAAAAITLHRRAGAGVVDLRLWRLLKHAETRLRARLA
jgi:hypothetical protein